MLVFSKELQEQLLEYGENKTPYFMGRTAFYLNVQAPVEFENIGIFLHPVDRKGTIIKVETEMYREHSLLTSAVLNIKERLLIPFVDIQLEDGPITRTAENFREVYKKVMLKAFFQMVDLLFFEDGSIDCDEMDAILPHSLCYTRRDHLIAGAAGILFASGNEKLTYHQFCKNLLTDHNLWYASVEQHISDCCITDDMIARCALLSGTEKELAYLEIIRTMIFNNNFALVDDLYLLARTMQEAKKELLVAPQKNIQAARNAVTKLNALKDRNYVIKVFIQSKTYGVSTEEIYITKDEFLTKLSPLGIVGTTSSRDINQYNFILYSWDEITKIKYGNAILYQAK